MDLSRRSLIGGLGGAAIAGLGGAGREGPRSDEPPREAMRDGYRLVLDRDRQRAHAGLANVDPYDISDIMRMYAPTRGDPTKYNAENEIDFNWKRWETYGRRDYAELREYHVQGWREVMHHHFPGRFAPEGTEGPVVVKDMILMERPMILTVQARNEEIDLATRAMRVNKQTVGVTPEGSAPRVVFTDRTTREAIEIPRE